MNDATEFRSVTYRLRPGTRARHRKLVQIAGACRYVWNHFLARNRRDYATFKLRKALFDAGLVLDKPSPPSVSFQSTGVRFTALRRETPWLQRLPYVPVRYALKYQADAWTRAFAGGGFPRFKARRGDDSFTIPQNVCVREDVLSVPKVGRVRLSRRGGNPHAGCPPVEATVKRVNGKWYCVIVYKVSAVARPDNGLALGVDMNCGQVAASTGDLLRMPDMARLQARKRRYQRMVARRKERFQSPQSGPPPPRPHATAHRHDAPSLAPRDKPDSRRHRRTARHRGPEDEGHDPIRQGVGGASGPQCRAESGTQPGNPEYRLVAIATDA